MSTYHALGRTRTRAGLALGSVLLLLVAGACADTTTETVEVPTPAVKVSGGIAVLVGETLSLTATTANGTDEGYTWSSDNTSVATVAADGTVTGLAAGTAIVTATGTTTRATGTWGVHVYTEGGGVQPGPDPTPKVVVGGPVAVDVGDTIELAALTIDGTDSAYAWASSDPAIATVDAAGVVTGVAEGEATITATGADTQATGTWGVYVVGEDVVTPPPDPDPVVTVTGNFSVVEGETLQLSAATEHGEDASYTWASSDLSVATVDGDGLVTGVAPGEVIISATGGGTGAVGRLGVVVVPIVEEPPPPVIVDPGVPLFEAWSGSPHADAASESFRHWDADGAVPTSCARCHSSPGYLDYLGVDGTAAGTVDNPAPTDTVVGCVTCHNAGTIGLDQVTFPSGVTVTGTGSSSRCMLCHQGRQSTVSVDQRIATAAVGDDEVSGQLSFQNIHYLAAGATLYGGVAKGGYQYGGRSYDVKFHHVEGYGACTDCHDPHTLELKVAGCTPCHAGVETAEDFRDIRMLGSLADYDGDGDRVEGVYHEIQGLHGKLYDAILAYAATVAGTPIVYDSHAHPYFFADANGNGARDDGETGYAAWTPRLLRAAYNYQYSAKDPGGYAHNGKYIIELLYDSIADLNVAIDPDEPLAGAHRVDPGHFAGSEEAWRHWDGDGEVPANCARCHSASGLERYLLTGRNVATEPANGMMCATCHDHENFPALFTAAQVTFPSGLTVDTGSNQSNLCMQCHQGREAGVTLQARIAGLPEDEVAASLRFVNVHYFAAGATRWGTQAGGGYEYEGSTYNGYFHHTDSVQQCADCHDVHALTIKYDACATCHPGVTGAADLHEIRMAGSTVDYDGDGDTEEGIAREIESLHEELYAAIQGYATGTVGTGIVFDPARYPYWFNGEGAGFASWTPRLLKAAYNYQYVAKDPGAFAHNPRYVVQLLFDSISDLGAATGDLARNPGPHFDATSEAFRHWDAEGHVPAACARCHGGQEGFVAYLANDYVDTGRATDVAYGMTCETCHTGQDYAGAAPLRAVEKVVFPGGAEIANPGGDSSFLCMTCHQGRVSKATIDAAIAGGTLRFQNIHYLSAGATLYGSQARVGYEYEGRTYAGKFNHFGGTSTQCTYCHVVTGAEHTYEPAVTAACTGCHAGATDVTGLRLGPLGVFDYDGDGNRTEPLRDEIDTLAGLLLAQMQTVADIAYDGDRYPYFFADANQNGAVDSGEGSFTAWTAPLVKAAHNFQMSQKEPGAWAHNIKYTAQLLMDSIVDLGGNLTALGLVRPN
jgi:hypothetical protein